MKTTKEQITVRSDTGAPAWRMAAVLCVLAIVVAAMALLMPADVQAATGTPVAGSNLAILQQQSALTLTVVSQNVILNSGAYTVAVPITLTGDSSRKVAAAAFSLDYDSACLQYSSVDFSGISGDFERTIANDNDDTDGELDIAIYDADSPKAQLEAPATVATVTFVVLAPKCQKDTVTDIYFSTAPAPSLGGPGGQQIAVTPVSGTVTIDWNRTATSITLTPVVINENQPVSTTVGTVSSDDPDGVNDTYTFTLVAGAGDTDNGSFTLNGTTLNATPSFNFEVKKDYTVRIQVNDGKGGVYAQQFAITVVDVNETPTALALDSYSVVEDMGSAGQTVANVAVTDPDNGDAFSTDDTFTMTLAGADAAYFDVSDMQITVRASGVLSAEAKSSYTFDVVITDNDGGTGTSTAEVTVIAPPLIASDSFQRAATGGLGSADVGGAWTPVGSTSRLSVGLGSAAFRHDAPGNQDEANLTSVSTSSADLTVSLWADEAATGGGLFTSISARRLDPLNRYDARVRFATGDKVGVTLTALKGSSTVTGLSGEVTLPGTYPAGTRLSVRLQTFGSSPTTIRVKVWAAGSVEPAAWLIERTDSHPALQVAGQIGLRTYLSAAATVVPVSVRFDDLRVVAVKP